MGFPKTKILVPFILNVWTEMTKQMTVKLSSQKVRQHLLKYFETRDDMEVTSEEPDSVGVRTLGWKHPWINIKIRMFGEEKDRTRLTIDFSFRKVYAILITVTVMVMAFVWIIAVNMLEAIVITIIIATGASIVFASDISQAKRKFLDDICEAFSLPEKTD